MYGRKLPANAHEQDTYSEIVVSKCVSRSSRVETIRLPGTSRSTPRRSADQTSVQYSGLEFMPRPKVGDKRADILVAATARIAEEGVGASTASIAKAARVAEGSLFRYFEDKDHLLNDVYVEIKRDLRRPLSNHFPLTAPLRKRAEHVWNAYVSWGTASPAKLRALAQLTVSDRITQQTRGQGEEGLEAITRTVAEVVERGRLAKLPASFARALFLSIAETTMSFMADDPERSEKYKAAGFQAFWSAAANK
jgi:AcrR family transcriptional regulator